MNTSAARRLADGLKAVVRYRVRSKMEMRVLDLTEGGCMLEAKGWAAKPAERVSVKLPGLGAVAATVVWIEEQRAGLAFEEALYGPVIEQMFA